MAEFLNKSKAAEYVDCSPDSLDVWRSTGAHAVGGVKIGKEVFYRQADLDAVKPEIHGRPGARKAKP